LPKLTNISACLTLTLFNNYAYPNASAMHSCVCRSILCPVFASIVCNNNFFFVIPTLFQVRVLKDFFDMLSNVRLFPWNAWFLVFVVSNYFPNHSQYGFSCYICAHVVYLRSKFDWNCGFLIGSRSSVLWTKARGGCSWTHGSANSTHHRWVIQVSLIRVNLNIWTNRMPEMLKLFLTLLC
jgi:hypothetical protein